MLKPAPMVPYTISARNRHGDLEGIEPATFAAKSITLASARMRKANRAQVANRAFTLALAQLYPPLRVRATRALCK